MLVYRFLILQILFLMGYSLWAIPAYPKIIPISIGDKIINIRLYGNENYKWAETDSGYTIIQNEKQQWCYAKLNSDSTLSATNYLLGRQLDDASDFKNFIESTPKHLARFIQKKDISSLHASQHINKKTATGERRILIILMEYQDLKFSKNKDEFDRLFNEEGYNDDNAQGSVRDFYNSASYNQLALASDIYGPYTATHEMGYYGQNYNNTGYDVNVYALFEEAIQNVAKEIDLTPYDCDGDGFIDNVHIIFAGYGEEAGAASNAIWSHESTFFQPYEIQGLKINQYSCAPELRGNSGKGISRIGAHCHEIGHALGAMDYYDTDYQTGGEYRGTGEWDIMAEGSWNNEGITPADFNPYVKSVDFGWISPKPLPTGEVCIAPSYSTPNNYYILQSAENRDYYILENRTKDEWGAGLPGEGLLIYHIHSDIENAGNTINCSTPQKCYIVCASSNNKRPNNSPSSYGNINSAGCPFPGTSNNNDFGQNSTPMAFFWEGSSCGIELNNIHTLGDGSIELINNSIGADFEKKDMQQIFFEGFEEDIQVDINESSGVIWQIGENAGNTLVNFNKPVAYAGTKFLQLSAMYSINDVSNSIEFSCNPINSIGGLHVMFYVISMNLQFNNQNTIRLKYYDMNAKEWREKDFTSSKNSTWELFSINLPTSVMPNFIIEGTVSAGSVLAIDNITVEQEIIQNDVTNLNTIKGSDQSEICYIYTTSGVMVAKTNLNNIKSLHLPKGMYILRIDNGKSRIINVM
ncbi:MAG: M6 family metalloprotease domain-containing protein [Prevotellaceae bacterium]|nr:M6 family metalloprotease domain-containing protein [Prevotellaceae bacterium]